MREYSDYLRDEIDKREREIESIKKNESIDDEERDIMIDEIRDEIQEIEDELEPYAEEEQEEERMSLCLSQGLSRYC
jgi:uncharacterized membrane protein YukC